MRDDTVKKNFFSGRAHSPLKKIFLAGALSAVLAVGATAGPASAYDAPSMDIYEAIERTLADNLTLRSMRLEADNVAVVSSIRASNAPLPSLTLTGSLSDQREPQTNDGSDISRASSAYARIEQPLYTGGRVSALRRQAPKARRAAYYRLAAEENAAIGELFARFYLVLLQEQRIEAAHSAVATSEAHFRQIERMSELGLSNRLEVIRASEALATNRAQLASAEGASESAQIALMNYMGIPPEGRRPIAGELSVIEVEGDRASSYAAAMEHRADRSALSEQVSLQSDQVEIERSAALPQVSLGASAGWLDPYRNADRGSDTWRAELTISVPILDRGAARGAVYNAKTTLKKDRITLEQKDLDIKSEVETAWTELETTTKQLHATRLALDLAEESLRLAEVGFQEGVTPQLDLLSAQTSLNEARLSYISALYSRMLATVALKVTEGSIIDWTNEVSFR